LIQGQPEPSIDAYATALSLDAAGQNQVWTPVTAPVRFSILDLNNDLKFDENDLTSFLAHFLDANGNPVEPQGRDYSRFDLNGDGFTGGSRTELFDFDRMSSTQYGATLYAADVTQMIEGNTIHFNSKTATDLQILCYYAYSPLFTGDPVVRATLMKGCGTVTVKVNPVTITLAPGGTQQFGATVLGTNDPRVNWRATGGTITATGLYTAPGTGAGPFKVRATSVVDGTAFAEATVTIAPLLLFTFDTDLQGWTPVPATLIGCFNLATWARSSELAGVVVLDGVDAQPPPPPGHPILCSSIPGFHDNEPNSYIFKLISLPAQATTLEFDVAGHGSPFTHSQMRIRFAVLGGPLQIVLDWTTIIGNPGPNTMPPQFSHRTIDISAFAGQRVNVFFEQGDDGGNQNEQVYLDNIWFH
jgi:hypothetical protein